MEVQKEDTIDICAKPQFYSLCLGILGSQRKTYGVCLEKMVKIAIAGGSGSRFRGYLIRSVTNGSADVAQEVIDVLVAAKKHEILLLSRKVRILSAHIFIAGSLQLSRLHRMLRLARPPRV